MIRAPSSLPGPGKASQQLETCAYKANGQIVCETGEGGKQGAGAKSREGFSTTGTATAAAAAAAAAADAAAAAAVTATATVALAYLSSGTSQEQGVNSNTTLSTHIVGFSGRYIKLQQPAVGCMHFAEVQVFSTPNGANVAQGAAVTASSTYSTNFPSANLTDGNMTNYAHSSCDDSPYFLIDLGSVVAISNIRIFNRTDCCQSRENGVVVSVLDHRMNTVFAADPLRDSNGVNVYHNDRSMDAAAYKVYNITPPNKAVSGDGVVSPPPPPPLPPPPPDAPVVLSFQLQDVSTGRKVTYSSSTNAVAEDSSASVVDWKIFNDSSVYNNGQGAVGMCDSLTNNYMRHSGMVIWESSFTANNYDFAWVFKRTGRTNVYNLFNYYGDNNYLNFNGTQLLISSDTPLQWQVIGSNSALAQIQSIAR